MSGYHNFGSGMSLGGFNNHGFNNDFGNGRGFGFGFGLGEPGRGMDFGM